jgi:hypothetical protein
MKDDKAFANALMEGWMIDAITESGEMYGRRLEGVNALRDWIGSSWSGRCPRCFETIGVSVRMLAAVAV